MEQHRDASTVVMALSALDDLLSYARRHDRHVAARLLDELRTKLLLGSGDGSVWHS